MRGYTLIELLVVITIIAIVVAIGVATFSYAQKVSRDGRRIADVRSIEAALELYYTKNRIYPTAIATGWTNSSAQPGTWINQALTGYEAFTPTYMRAVPNDPVNTGNYAYWYQSYSPVGYKVMVRMELSNSHAKNTADGGVCDGWFEVFTANYQNRKPTAADDAAVCNTP